MSFNISSVGDIMLGDNLHHYRRGVASSYNGRFPELLTPDTLSVINRSDLFFGNFECSLMPDSDWETAHLERAIYAAPESAISFFKGWRPRIILNVANNHFGQHGKDVATFTIECLERQGFHCIGKTRYPVEITSNGRRVMAWGVSIVEDKYEDAGYFKSTPENLIAEIDWIEKRPNDYWVVSIHWGDEYLTLSNSIQEELTGRLVEKGVDLILGHHPHVVQPVRRHSHAVVAFSQGNFIFDQNFSKLTRIGLLMLITNAGSKLKLYEVTSKKYRMQSLREIDEEQLSAYCRNKCSRFAPLLMRILMKLELVLCSKNVPSELWRYFGTRIKRRISSR